MKNILITGATGNVGTALIKALLKLNNDFEIYAGIRHVEKDKPALAGFQIKTIQFDFNDINTFKPALERCDILFLLRPPQISEVTNIFKPLIETAIQCAVKHVIFISVQGVEKSKIIPHHKIEKLIVESNINYTFLRPAYFMQNFTSTLLKELLLNKRIFLPAGKAKFTVVDTADIGKVAAKIINDTTGHLNKCYELTNHEKLSFGEMAEKLSKGLKTDITYESPNLFRFFVVQRKEKMPVMLILVMIMLHYFPRFQRAPETSDWVNKISGDEPTSFDEFVFENKNVLNP